MTRQTSFTDPERNEFLRLLNSFGNRCVGVMIVTPVESAEYAASASLLDAVKAAAVEVSGDPNIFTVRDNGILQSGGASA